MDILFEDAHLLAMNKPAGMPVQPDPTGDASLLDAAALHTGHPVYLVHRLDRPVSGAVVMAKTATAAAHLSAQFRDRGVGKTYLALVSGPPPMVAGELVHYFTAHRQGRARVSEVPVEGGVEAVLSYRLLRQTDRYWLLEVMPVQGRFHQIRAQLAAVGCPIRGDVKYGARRGNADRSIQLHAWRLTLEHPEWNRPLLTEAPPPSLPFWQLV
jgi:23S rRNA pseudouridine1911/1915/1917 synthase